MPRLSEGKANVKDIFHSRRRDTSISQNPIRCLGKVYDNTLSDINNAVALEAELKRWLEAIDHSSIYGRFRAWSFQFGINPRLQWPFLLYDIAITRVERMERLVSRYLRKWMGLPPSFSSNNLYNRRFILPSPLTSTVEEFKATKARGLLTLQQSKDPMTRNLEPPTSKGRKWNTEKAVADSVSRLKHKQVVGVVCKGRLGLGHYESTWWDKADDRTRRKMAVDGIRTVEEEQRNLRLSNMSGQGDTAVFY